MNIRHATANDARRVKVLIEENNKSDGTGFYEMPIHSEEEYARRLANNPLALVAEEEGKVVGFIVGYTDEMLYDLGVDRIMSQYLAENSRPFTFIEAVAVDKDLQGSGVGGRLFTYALDQIESMGIPVAWCNIVHKPIKNKRSVPLVEKLGFVFVEELRVPEIDITFGIYKKDFEKAPKAET